MQVIDVVSATGGFVPPWTSSQDWSRRAGGSRPRWRARYDRAAPPPAAVSALPHSIAVPTLPGRRRPEPAGEGPKVLSGEVARLSSLGPEQLTMDMNKEVAMQVIPGPRYVIVGFDGSPNSAAALRRAAAEAQDRHARLDVVRVVPAGSGIRQRVTAWLRLRDETARLLPHAQHVSTRLRIARGDAGEQLSRLAGRADLLVVGARLNSRHGTPLGGDTVPTVLSNAHCDVIVCENDATEYA